MFQMTHFALDRIPTLSRTGTVQKLWHTMAGRRHDPARHIPRNGFHHTWTETHRFHRPLSKLKANIIQLRLFLFSSLCDFFILVWCSVTCRIRLRMYYQKHTHFSISLAYSYKMMSILLVVKKTPVLRSHTIWLFAQISLHRPTKMFGRYDASCEGSEIHKNENKYHHDT